MVPEMVSSTEVLATDVAREGPLVCVSAFVDLEVIGLGEGAMAELTDEALVFQGGRHQLIAHCLH